MSDLPTIPLSRSALLGVLTTIQNSAAFAGQDILSFAGMCSTTEVIDHVQACFGRLPEADKARALNELRRRVAPVSAVMVPQQVQQQQGSAQRHLSWSAALVDVKADRVAAPVFRLRWILSRGTTWFAYPAVRNAADKPLGIVEAVGTAYRATTVLPSGRRIVGSYPVTVQGLRDAKHAIEAAHDAVRGAA